jgi:Ca2+-binding RTX toxin-like protein
MSTFVSIAGSGNVDLKVYGDGTVVAGGGNDNIDITGYGHITVGGGHDTLTLNYSGIISQTGSHGLDTITVGTSDAVIYEQGQATVHGVFGALDFYGGMMEVKYYHGVPVEQALSGHMTMIGGALDPEFLAGPGTSYMLGGTGADTFVGGTGHATMVGGTSHNLFEFITKEVGGQDVIKNFVSGHDQLYLEGESLSYLQANHDISVHDGNTYISLDGGQTTIELQGVTTLKASDITTIKH